MPTFLPVNSREEIAQVAALASQIWTQHYTPFLAPGQVPYMLAKFQSAGVIANQLEAGHQYFLVVDAENPIGYFDFVLEEDCVFISKIYILQTQRGKGFGNTVINFIGQRAQENGRKKLRLTVNKYNSAAINAYQKSGFKNVKDVVVDIGGGFVMDDFVLEKELDEK